MFKQELATWIEEPSNMYIRLKKMTFLMQCLINTYNLPQVSLLQEKSEYLFFFFFFLRIKEVWLKLASSDN